MQHSNGGKNSFIIPPDLLDDIASRFLLDAPDRELSDPIALCFLTELAYWFYLDEYVEDDENLNTIKFDPFALQLFGHMDVQPKKGSIEEMLQNFREFKLRVPTYGALILNEDLSHVLLVQGFWRRASWGFPKGKINVEEEPYDCAIREVLEETGYDISSRIDKNDYLETTIGEQKVRLYIIPYVSMKTDFVPKTKGEIKEFKWFLIHQLPVHKHDKNFAHNARFTNMFYMVMPFVKLMRTWIANKSRSGSIPNDRGGQSNKDSRRRHKSLSDNQSKKTYNQSPCPSADFSKQKFSHNNTGYFERPESFQNSSEKFRGSREVSPKKKDNKPKNKGKKANGQSESSTEEHQKFSFKSRKPKGNPNKPAERSVTVSKTKDHSKVFSSYSWQNFKLNKKAINEAFENAWNGVYL